jgi:hypothetical protein
MYLDINQFDFIKDHEAGYKKKFYKHKVSGTTYIISNSFSAEYLASYLANGLYKLMLGNRVPNQYLIKLGENSWGLGSEFIPEFQTISKFANGTDQLKIIRECFPYSCSLPNLEKIEGFEEVVAAMIMIGESDAQYQNIGLIPNSNSANGYLVSKIDHDRSFTDITKAQDNLSAMRFNF